MQKEREGVSREREGDRERESRRERVRVRDHFPGRYCGGVMHE